MNSAAAMNRHRGGLGHAMAAQTRSAPPIVTLASIMKDRADG